MKVRRMFHECEVAIERSAWNDLPTARAQRLAEGWGGAGVVIKPSPSPTRATGGKTLLVTNFTKEIGWLFSWCALQDAPWLGAGVKEGFFDAMAQAVQREQQIRPCRSATAADLCFAALRAGRRFVEEILDA
jgi:hypothetical protein